MPIWAQTLNILRFKVNFYFLICLLIDGLNGQGERCRGCRPGFRLGLVKLQARLW